MQKQLAIFLEKAVHAHKLKKPFVVYKKPNENQLVFFAQHDSTLHELTSFNDSGFVFCPFSEKDKSIIFPSSKSSIDFFELPPNANSSQEKKQFKNTSFAEKKKHLTLVEKGIDFIATGAAEKVVLSRKEEVIAPSFNMLATFYNMLYKYHNAFVYLWYHPKIGMWMGATPERLLTVKNNRIKTVALAGTQLYKGDLNVAWGKKELQEQQFVTAYIVSHLNNELDHLTQSKTETVQAGNLLHLKTVITGTLKPNCSIRKVIRLLHPTPAVCGLPKQQAFNFILQNEGYDRQYYSGFLGVLNLNEETYLSVNLRCMKIEDNKVSIFVGGGITKDSIPVDEWEETVSKSKIIKHVL
ncbi:isochorismate synthase [Lutibacter sp.]